MPSAVSIFPGLRESKVEEIKNAITNESTRFVNIWGSSGFGKTSTAVETAHNLSACGYPVYFLQMQHIDTVDRLLLKILSIFRSNLVNVGLAAEYELVSIFTEIRTPIILILDNIDDLLTTDDSSAKIVSLFLEFLNSSSNINILVTSRELLENMRDQVKGFQNFRIQPLSQVSSLNFVRQLLPSFSKNVVTRVANICFHVPLAIKLVTSLIKENSEEIANKVLKELDVQEHRMEHLQQRMPKFFDMPYKRLVLADKHALISLTVFSSPVINKDAAIDVVSGEKGVTSNAIRTLKTLVMKSLIDEDPKGEYYSIHPLIFSFIVNKASQTEMNDVLHAAKSRFCSFYLNHLEILINDFLLGKVFQIPTMVDVFLYLQTVISMVFTCEYQNFQQDLFRILSKAEIFFFTFSMPVHIKEKILTVYDLAIEKCKIRDDTVYLKLIVSNYFQNIAFSLFIPNMHPDIPIDVRRKISLLSDGTASKLSSYEGLASICNGNVKNGIQQIEMSLCHLGSCSDHLLLKCLYLQVLILYYSNLKQSSKASEFVRMAVEVCEKLGNYNLFLINHCEFQPSESSKENMGEPLVLFSYLLVRWSKSFLTDKMRSHICNFLYNLQLSQDEEPCVSYYLQQIHWYSDWVLASLGINEEQEILFDERIEVVNKSLQEYQDHCSSGENIFLNMTEVLSERLFRMYALKSTLTSNKDVSVVAGRKALDLAREQYGEQHFETGVCYYKIGLAESSNEDHSSALKAFDKAIAIITSISEHEEYQLLSEVYLEQGKTYKRLGKFKLAIASCEKALELKGKAEVNPESEEVAEILDILALVQMFSKHYTSARESFERCLEIRRKLFSAKLVASYKVAENYFDLGILYNILGYKDKSKMYFENALKQLNSTDYETENVLFKTCIYEQLVNLKVDGDSYVELLLQNLPFIKEHCNEFVPIIYLSVAGNQLESGKYEVGLKLLQEALDVELDVLRQGTPELREKTVFCYLSVLETLLKQGKLEIGKKVVDRAITVSESLSKCKQPHWMFRCYCWKARFHGEQQNFADEVNFLEKALLQLSKIPDESKNKMSEFTGRREISRAHMCQQKYEDALKSLYEALSIIRNISPDGSVYEAELFNMLAHTAHKLKIKKLVVSNLRLAYKMYLKVLGKQDPKTEVSYIRFLRALMN